MSNDLKEFLLNKHFTCLEEMSTPIDYLSHKDNAIYLDDLGLFFWERGGKQFVDFVLTLKKLGAVPSKVNNVKIGWKELLAIAKDEINETKDERNADAQDFLDSVACFGETKVKELIKENGV